MGCSDSIPHNGHYLLQIHDQNDQSYGLLPNHPNSMIQNFTNQPSNQLISGPNSQYEKGKTLKRSQMDYLLDRADSFVQHHLKYESYLSKFTSANSIKRRQIIEHNKLECWIGMYDDLKGIDLKTDSLMTGGFFQRLMLDIFIIAEKEFFTDKLDYNQVRRHILEKYLFELYQLKEFLQAGIRQDCSQIMDPTWAMNFLLNTSDGFLFPILKYLKAKYPQIASTDSKKKFPIIDQMTVEINLLQHFPSQCYSSPNYINVQNIFNDLKFLFDLAANQFPDFQKDMQTILGNDVKTDYKVKIEQGQNGSRLYNASAVRRILIKWMEATLQQIPEIIFSEAFFQFIQSKSLVINEFHFKSTSQETTHHIIMKLISEFLEKAKYDIKTLKQNKKFGFYIYDLLRCKIKKNETKDLIELLESVKRVTKTPSGKKFEVVRIRDRFKSVNRDVLLNIRYGDVLVIQCQIALDSVDSEKDIKNNKFGHYCYELERGLFGPTLEMIMQHEDFERQDIKVTLKAEGLIRKRQPQKTVDFMKKLSRKCLNGHVMISLKGNFLANDPEKKIKKSFRYVCDFCLSEIKDKEIYNFCYYCTQAFCTKCETKMTQKLSSVEKKCNTEVIPNINQLSDLTSKFNQCPIVVFYLENGTSSMLFKDTLTQIVLTYKNVKDDEKEIPKMYAINCNDDSTRQLCSAYKVKEFPTMILFDQKGTAQITMIGATVNKIEGIINAQKRLLTGKAKHCEMVTFLLKQQCWCLKPMKYVDRKTGNAPKIDKVLCHCCQNDCMTFEEDKSYAQDFLMKICICPSGHMTCMNCSFLAIPEPSKYKDYKGLSYLIDQASNQNPAKNDAEFVNHTVEASAEEAARCICNRYFKKTYHSRDYTIANKFQKSQHPIQELVSLRYKPYRVPWQCSICDRFYADGTIHLACFDCPVFSDVARTNYEICIECAVKEKIIHRPALEKEPETKTSLTCIKNHSVIIARQKYPEDGVVWSCKHCKDPFYINTERFYCKTCKGSLCIRCMVEPKQDFILNPRSVRPVKKCKNDHFMKLYGCQEYSCASRRLCDECGKNLIFEFFGCRGSYNQTTGKPCNFSLCYTCAMRQQVYKKPIYYNSIANKDGRQKDELEQKVNKLEQDDIMNHIGRRESD